MKLTDQQLEQFDREEITAKEAREAMWAEIRAYDFNIPLPDHMKGQEWALKTPEIRDTFFGDHAQHESWLAHKQAAMASK